MPNEKKRVAKRLVDSNLNLTEDKESLERTQAELKEKDPGEAEGQAIIAALLEKNV